MLMGSSSRSPVGGDAPASPKYSDRLSPAINNYLSEASRQEVRVRFFFFFWWEVIYRETNAQCVVYRYFVITFRL